MNTGGTLYQSYVAAIMLCNKQPQNLSGYSHTLAVGWDDWGNFALFHGSHTPEGWFGHSWLCQSLKWKHVKHRKPLRLRFRTDTLSFFPHIIGQSKSWGQFRLKGQSNRHHLWSERNCKVSWQRAWIQGGAKNLGRWCNQATRDTSCSLVNLLLIQCFWMCSYI